MLAPWMLRVPLVIAGYCSMEYARSSGCHLPPHPWAIGLCMPPFAMGCYRCLLIVNLLLTFASLVACDHYFACTMDIASQIALYTCFLQIASLVAYERCLLAPWILRVSLVFAGYCTMDIARSSGYPLLPLTPARWVCVCPPFRYGLRLLFAHCKLASYNRFLSCM